MLTQGVDVQPDRLEARVWAWGREKNPGSWPAIIYGDPNLDEGTPAARGRASPKSAAPHRPRQRRADAD